MNLSDNQLRNLPVSILNLTCLTALWLSNNQSTPLTTLQQDVDKETGQTVCVNFMLPQSAQELTLAGTDNQIVVSQQCNMNLNAKLEVLNERQCNQHSTQKLWFTTVQSVPDLTPLFVQCSYVTIYWLWQYIKGGHKLKYFVKRDFCSQTFVGGKQGWRFMRGLTVLYDPSTCPASWSSSGRSHTILTL